MKIIFTKGSKQKQKFKIAEGVARIGRDSVNDIKIDDLGCSREHIHVSCIDGVGYLLNKQPSNPVYLNGRVISQKMKIISGDVVCMAETEFVVYNDDEKPPAFVNDIVNSSQKEAVAPAPKAPIDNNTKINNAVKDLMKSSLTRSATNVRKEKTVHIRPTANR